MYNLPLLLVVIIESPPLLMGVILEYTSYAVKRTHQLKLVGFEGTKKPPFSGSYYSWQATYTNLRKQYHYMLKLVWWQDRSD